MRAKRSPSATATRRSSWKACKNFVLGTFAMPSMEGEGIEAKARTIEVATGFLSAIKKDIDHDEMVVDFLKFYTSAEGYSIFLEALIENGGVPDGLPLVKGVELEGELAEMFANIEYIGNCQKGFCQALARGIGDNQEAVPWACATPWICSTARSPWTSGPSSIRPTS